MGVCGVFIFLCCCHCQRLCTANPNELAWISMRLVRLSFEWFGVCACATHILCIDLLAQHSVKVSRSTVCEWCDLSHLTHFSVKYCPFVTLSRTVRSLARSRSLFLSLKHKHCDLLSKHFNGVLVLVLVLHFVHPFWTHAAIQTITLMVRFSVRLRRRDLLALASMQSNLIRRQFIKTET